MLCSLFHIHIKYRIQSLFVHTTKYERITMWFIVGFNNVERLFIDILRSEFYYDIWNNSCVQFHSQLRYLISLLDKEFVGVMGFGNYMCWRFEWADCVLVLIEWFLFRVSWENIAKLFQISLTFRFLRKSRFFSWNSNNKNLKKIQLKNCFNCTWKVKINWTNYDRFLMYKGILKRSWVPSKLHVFQ